MNFALSQVKLFVRDLIHQKVLVILLNIIILKVVFDILQIQE